MFIIVQQFHFVWKIYILLTVLQMMFDVDICMCGVKMF